MSTNDISDEDFTGLVSEVLQRLAKDPSAAHLWQWKPRPGCEDEPYGQSRRNHLGAMLGLMSAAALPMVGCSSRGSCGDEPVDDSGVDSSGDSAADSSLLDARADTLPCADDPCAADSGADATPDATPDAMADATPDAIADAMADAPTCGDDPCACADDPCGCADDPCACADDPCACADDPCSA